jgi:glutaminyl-tRNA synthetase
MSEEKSLNFLEEIIEKDLENNTHNGRVLTRFPPEPNGYLHIGHAKSICLNFGLAKKYNGKCNLRFDDTNPTTEETEYVESIKADIQWLGFQWDEELYTSDYFDQLYAYAVKLIEKGLAYVDDSTAEEIAAQKGTPTSPGVTNSFRERSVQENLDLFSQMKNGDFPDGAKVLRAKIDMKHVNMLMRDPVIYRIKHAHHHRAGDKWCIYPMYDFAHGQSDSIEQITHSICTLEFVPHRELYDWFIEKLEIFPSHQYEFARGNVNYTVTSKRRLLQLVKENFVESWDDPRMPTISGFRRRGFTPESIRVFWDKVGIAKRDNVIDFSLLEFCVREDLNKIAPRVMAVLNPVKLVITNYPNGNEEWLEAENNPEEEVLTYRKVPFSKELYIEREDFQEEANKKFFRLTLGTEVRLKNAYIIKGESVVKDANGNITEIHCTYDVDSRSGSGTEASQRKVKGTIHWVSIAHAVPAEVRIYDRLFSHESPDGNKEIDFKEFINPNSLEVITGYVEPSLKTAKNLDHFQFQRLGYYCVDKESNSDKLVFNKTVGLRDTWAKVESKE